MHCLFIGNSYTFYNDMPGQVASLLHEMGVPAAVTVTAEGGANLEAHEQRAETVSALAEASWTHLVIQEQSTRPLHDRKKFLTSLVRLCEGAQGRPVTLYQTWARQDGHEVYRSRWSGRSPSAMTEGLEEAYREAEAALSKEGHRVSIAPVGTTWFRTICRHPELNLFDDDGHHASAAGSHLAALVIAAALSEPTKVSETTYAPADVIAANARTLRQTLASA